MKPQTVQIVRQGEATPYWFKVNLLYQPLTYGMGKESRFYPVSVSVFKNLLAIRYRDLYSSLLSIEI